MSLIRQAIRCRLAVETVAAVLTLQHGPNSVRAVNHTGVNLAGAEFGESNLPGTYNVHYTYPTAVEVDYFLSKGMNTFRLPFRWERLQQSPSAPLNTAEFARLNSFVTYATGKGANVILDPHNYARYHGNVVGSPSVPHAAFADFWSRLSGEFKSNDRVIFGLMNEPHTMPTEQWRDAANAAISAIRTSGATNLILVPGNAWTGAHSWTQNWYGSPNASVMLTVTDPANNFAFDVHQYLDSDSSGTTSQIVSATIGRERLVAFTNWLRANQRRGFLGEFGVANSQVGPGPTQIGDEAIHNMLSFVEANNDVWLGWTWWAAGPWWGNYRFTLEPTSIGQPNQTDRPSMAVLEPHFVAQPSILAGDFNDDGAVDAADYVTWRNSIGNSALVNETASLGQVDLADYQAWRAYFGDGRANNATATVDFAVPEPPTRISWAALTVFWIITASAFRS